MHSLVTNGAIAHCAFTHLADAVSPSADAHDALGDQRFHLAGIADHADLLLVLARLGKHAQVQRCPLAARVLHDHVRIVEDVGLFAVVQFVEVVDVLCPAGHHSHRLRPDEQVHQIEEVTALLHQSAAGVSCESIPVADLAEKGEAMLANGNHPKRSHCAAAYLVDNSLCRRHIAILETHPDHPLRPAHGFSGCDIDGVVTVSNCGAQRFLDEHVMGSAQHVEQHLAMSVIRRGDDNHIAKPRCK